MQLVSNVFIFLRLELSKQTYDLGSAENFFTAKSNGDGASESVFRTLKPNTSLTVILFLTELGTISNNEL